MKALSHIGGLTATVATGSKAVSVVGDISSWLAPGYRFGSADGLSWQIIDTPGTYDNGATTFSLAENWGGASLAAGAAQIEVINEGQTLGAKFVEIINLMVGGVLEAIASIPVVNNNIIQWKNGAPVGRSPEQLLSDLSGVGAATKTGAETLTNKTLGSGTFFQQILPIKYDAAHTASLTVGATGNLNVETTSHVVKYGSGIGSLAFGWGTRITGFMGVQDDYGGVVYGLRATSNAVIDPVSGYPVVGFYGFYAGMGLSGSANYNADANPVFGVNAKDQLTGTNYGLGHNLFNVLNNGYVSTYKSVLDDGAGNCQFGGNVLVRAANTYSLASASYPFANAYFQNAATITSDENYKGEIASLTEAEAAVAKEIAPLVVTYKMKSAIAAKGDALARRHCGWIAQRIEEVFVAHGLDPFAYGCVGFDLAVKTVEKTRSVTRQKTQTVTVEISGGEFLEIDGKAVFVPSVTTETREELVWTNERDLPAVDASGAPVMEKAGEDKNGNPILRQKMVHLADPVMETVEETYEEQVPDLDASGEQKKIHNIRMDEVKAFAIAGLAARVAALEAK